MTDFNSDLDRVLKYGADYTHEDFHSKIAADPRERTNHLVYADWLEEQGQPVLAAFIRETSNNSEYGTRWNGRVMHYEHQPRDPAPDHNSVFVHQGLGAFRERVVRRKPKPTLAVSVQSPYHEGRKGYLSFSLDLPIPEGEEWVRRLLAEGHPAGNPDGSPSLRRLAPRTEQGDGQ